MSNLIFETIQIAKIHAKKSACFKHMSPLLPSKVLANILETISSPATWSDRHGKKNVFYTLGNEFGAPKEWDNISKQSYDLYHKSHATTINSEPVCQNSPGTILTNIQKRIELNFVVTGKLKFPRQNLNSTSPSPVEGVLPGLIILSASGPCRKAF